MWFYEGSCLIFGPSTTKRLELVGFPSRRWPIWCLMNKDSEVGDGWGRIPPERGEEWGADVPLAPGATACARIAGIKRLMKEDDPVSKSSARNAALI